MVLGVEFTQTPPAKLILAFRALHEFAAFASHNHHFARRTHLSKHYLVQVTVSVTVIKSLYVKEIA